MIEKNEPRFIFFYYNVEVVSNKGSSFCFVYFVMFVDYQCPVKILYLGQYSTGFSRMCLNILISCVLLKR